jgi:thiol-disulfide isomerase/thioredoxin
VQPTNTFRAASYSVVLAGLVASVAWAGWAWGPPKVGAPAPDFTAYSYVTGARTTLADERGKVVILTFWATWCAPCRMELPNLEAIQEKVGKDQLVVLAVNFRESEETLRYLKKSAKEAGWKITMLMDEKGTVSDKYAVHSVPHMVLIGRDGKIAAVHSGFGEGSLDEILPEVNAALTGKTLDSGPAER